MTLISDNRNMQRYPRLKAHIFENIRICVSYMIHIFVFYQELVLKV